MKQKFLDIAELIDAYRIMPRLLVLCYGYMVYDVTMWFKILENPNGAQSTFISIVYGAAAGIFGFYAKSGRSWQVESNTSQNRSKGPVE